MPQSIHPLLRHWWQYGFLLPVSFLRADVEYAEVLAGSLEQKDQRAPHEQLSDREFEVFKMIVMGKSISEIGEILSLNVNTISTYRARIMDKMKLHNNADLVKYAIQNNLV